MKYKCLKCGAEKTEAEAVSMKKGKANGGMDAEKKMIVIEVPVHCDWKMVIVED